MLFNYVVHFIFRKTIKADNIFSHNDAEITVVKIWVAYAGADFFKARHSWSSL